MAKVSRLTVRVRDVITLMAVTADPDVRIRVTWKGSNRNSFYHGTCAMEGSEQIMSWIQSSNMKVLAIKRNWSKWRAPCAHCRGSINVPSRKPEQAELIP